METRRILVVTSVEVEQVAILRGIQGHLYADLVDVIVGGVGIAAAAASTATALARASYEWVICAGIAGGFQGRADIGAVVVASEMIAADLGVQVTDGFMSLDELGFGSTRIQAPALLVDRITTSLESKKLPILAGPIATVSTITGTADGALMLEGRVRGVMAEAMEGFGIAVAAQQQGVAMLEIRAISNLVGPRDRSAWRIGEALEALEAASTSILKTLYAD